MDTKIYEKTRYQNIYRNKKNKNYLVRINKPVRTSITIYNGEKIYKIEQALKVRDNPNINSLKRIKTPQILTFDDLWYKYIAWCKTTEKQAYNTVIRKDKTYKRYLKGKFKKKINKISENEFSFYVNKINCTDKTKNQIIKDSKAFFNWCVRQDIISYNPIANVKRYKEEKPKMKFWTPEELNKFLTALKKEIYENNNEVAYRTYIFTLISFSLGARTGETRALRFNSFNSKTNMVEIINSIDSNPENETHIKTTKTTHSARIIDVSQTLINEIKKYKWNLINVFDYDIIEDELIFCNHKTKKPITDTTLRKQFYYYCDLAGISRIRMYDLRHTYVAIMMSEGKELYHISQRIGHSSYSTTVDKYGHLSNKTRKELAKITDKYI